jgi:hypothetical protein
MPGISPLLIVSLCRLHGASHMPAIVLNSLQRACCVIVISPHEMATSDNPHYMDEEVRDKVSRLTLLPEICTTLLYSRSSFPGFLPTRFSV